MDRSCKWRQKLPSILLVMVALQTLCTHASAQQKLTQARRTRVDIAASAEARYKAPPSLKKVNAGDLALALGLDPASVPVSLTFGNPAQIAVFSQLGILHPTQGDNFVLMSSGVAGAGTGGLSSPQIGTDFGTSMGSLYDPAQLVIGPMVVPANQNSICIDLWVMPGGRRNVKAILAWG
jgi:hypothetical protein